MDTVTIRTARLELVPLAVADADEMVAVLGDPELYTYTGGEPPTRDQLVRRYTAQLAGPPAGTGETWHNWIVRRLSDRAAVGFVQATVSGGDCAEIAWVIGVPFQGYGYATDSAAALVAALADVGIDDVVAHIQPDHAASNAVAERIGLHPTERFVDGERVWRR